MFFPFDSTAVSTVAPTTIGGLIAYWMTLLSAGASMYVSKVLSKVYAWMNNLNTYLSLGLHALVALLTLKLLTVIGLSLPANPFGWDPTTVNTVVGGLLGWLGTKFLPKLFPPTPVATTTTSSKTTTK